MDVNQFSFKFSPRSCTVVVTGGKNTWALEAVLESCKAAEMLEAVQATLDRTGFNLDDSGFSYPNAEYLGWDEDVDGPIWEGVRSHVMADEVFAPEPTFARLMLRVAQTFIAGANEHDHPMLREPWWPELLDATRRLEDMVAALPPDESAA